VLYSCLRDLYWVKIVLERAWTVGPEDPNTRFDELPSYRDRQPTIPPIEKTPYLIIISHVDTGCVHGLHRVPIDVTADPQATMFTSNNTPRKLNDAMALVRRRRRGEEDRPRSMDRIAKVE
jgi:hypothetical protein